VDKGKAKTTTESARSALKAAEHLLEDRPWSDKAAAEVDRCRRRVIRLEQDEARRVGQQELFSRENA